MILVATVLMSSMAVAAMPTIGDYAQYEVTVTQGEAQSAMTFEQEITAFNQASNSYSVKSTVTSNGQVQTQLRNVESNSLFTTELVTQALANCTQAGGQSESVTTAAGTFDTCALPLTASNGVTGKINVGLVAFGVVRSEVVSGNQRTLAVLKSQRLGQ